MRKMLLLLLLVTLGNYARGQRGGGVRVQDETGQTRFRQFYSGSYALVIGAIDYTHGWRDLPGVKKDLGEVKDVLEKHGFQAYEGCAKFR